MNREPIRAAESVGGMSCANGIVDKECCGGWAANRLSNERPAWRRRGLGWIVLITDDAPTPVAEAPTIEPAATATRGGGGRGIIWVVGGRGWNKWSGIRPGEKADLETKKRLLFFFNK